MDWKFLISIIIAIVFGIPAFLSVRKEGLTKIFFIEESLINLYDKVVKNFENLKITYKGNNIKENMFVLRGFLYCLGKKDINNNDITKNVNLSLENGAVWHDCKIISYTKDLNPEVVINGSELLFQYDLLKNDDYIYFEALGEAKDNAYSISHRIANVPSIKKEELKTFRSIGSYIFMGFFC